jgi:hypothetical protein
MCLLRGKAFLSEALPAQGAKKRVKMGQSIYTALSMILAEEVDAQYAQGAAGIRQNSLAGPPVSSMDLNQSMPAISPPSIAAGHKCNGKGSWRAAMIGGAMKRASGYESDQNTPQNRSPRPY